MQDLSLVPLPPGDNVLKQFLDMILKIADDLEIDCIFAHAVETMKFRERA